MLIDGVWLCVSMGLPIGRVELTSCARSVCNGPDCTSWNSNTFVSAMSSSSWKHHNGAVFNHPNEPVSRGLIQITLMSSFYRGYVKLEMKT